MYVVDVDFKSGSNILHREECVHAVPDNSPDKAVGTLGDGGGWLSFTSPGEALRWLKMNRVRGIIVHCRYCAPLSTMTPEPVAKLNVSVPKTGCDACASGCSCSTEMNVTDTKSQYKRLVSRFLGEK
jgi:hypothetical protein